MMDKKVAHIHVFGLLEQFKDFGVDVDSEGLRETPKRYVKFLSEFLQEEPFNFTTFCGDEYGGMIISKDIPFYSICEHHLAPFFGTAAIAYIPGKDNRIVGISKLPRTLDKFARKLTNQERITKQVADYLNEHLSPKGVAVIIQARHLCQEMRGIKKPGTMTITSEVLGVFKDDMNARNELMNLLKIH